MTSVPRDARKSALDALLALYPAHGGVALDSFTTEMVRRGHSLGALAILIESLVTDGLISLVDSGVALDGGQLTYLYVTEAGAQYFDGTHQKDP